MEVQRIIHLQGIANQLPDVFTNNKKIVKSHIPTANTPALIKVPIGQSINTIANESKPHLKHGRPVGVKDKILQKRKVQEKQVVAYKEAIPMKQVTEIINPSKIYEQKSLQNEPPDELSPEEDQVPKNNEISIHYVYIGEIWIEIKLLLTTYFHIKLPLTLPKVMIMNINHKSSMNVDVEMIGQCGKR